MNKDLPFNNCQLVKDKVARDLAELQEKKMETALVNGRSKTYISDRIYKFRKEWWENWYAMLHSEDSSERKTALIEYNKLQQRVLPTQLEGGGSSTVQVNILNGVGVDNISDDNTIEAEIVE